MRVLRSVGFAIVMMLAFSKMGYAQPRYALLIGANRGTASDKQLRYAGTDARRLAEVLARYGGFSHENLVVMTDPNAQDVRSTIQKLHARMRSDTTASNSLFFVYYSGHADALSMHLSGTELLWQDIRELVAAAPAKVRILVVDACRSGQATRVKGAKISKPFALPRATTSAYGFAILSSATAGEDSQESDELQASFFTHHLLSGLRGVADSNHDGDVTLAEAYRYTADRTIASTASTEAGIQHPTYRYDISGRADVTLTRPSKTRGVSQAFLPKAGQYIFHRDSAEGPIILEASMPTRGGSVWIEPGVYYVRWRTPDTLYEGSIEVPMNATVAVRANQLRAVGYAQYVRKGGAGGLSWSTSAWAGYGTAMVDNYSGALLLALSTSVDLPAVTLDVQLRGGRSTFNQPEIDATLWETGLTVGARKVFDVGPLGLSAGLHAGGVFLAQSFQSERDAPARYTFAPTLGTLFRADLYLFAGVFFALQAELRVSWVNLNDGISDSHDVLPVQGLFMAGIGNQW